MKPARTRRAGRMQEPVRMGKGCSQELVNTMLCGPLVPETMDGLRPALLISVDPTGGDEAEEL